jgi:hypothetical protein
MNFDFPTLQELSPNTVAALIGAAVTLIAAIINLRIAWRREIVSRLQTKRGGKTRRGLLPAIGFLVIASAVGGYSLALYLMYERENDVASLRAELRERAGQMQLAADRLEFARVQERQAVLTEAAATERQRRGSEGLWSELRVAPCAARAEAPCTPDVAPRVAACVNLPSQAGHVEVVPFARLAAPDAAGSVVPVALGADLGHARIASAPVERADSHGTRQLCLDAWNWDAERWLELRIVVRYGAT